jgi:hypothetical protein
MDFPSFASLSSLRQSIERHRDEALGSMVQRTDPALGGLVGRALAQYMQEQEYSKEEDGSHAAESVPRHPGGGLADSNSMSSATSTQADEPSFAGTHGPQSKGLQANEEVEQDLNLEQPSDWPPVELREENATLVASSHTSLDGKGIFPAEGSISLADGLGAQSTARTAIHSPLSWAQEGEASVCIGVQTDRGDELGDTPSVGHGHCFPGIEEVTELDAESSAGDMPTPGPSSVSLIQALGSASPKSPPSSRHSVYPAEAIRAISLMPSPAQARPSGNRDSSQASISISFRQAHGLTAPASAGRSHDLPASSVVLQGASNGSPAGFHEAPEREIADTGLYGDVAFSPSEHRALSTKLQHMFYQAMAQVDSEDISAATSSSDPGHLLGLVERELLNMAHAQPERCGNTPGDVHSHDSGQGWQLLADEEDSPGGHQAGPPKPTSSRMSSALHPGPLGLTPAGPHQIPVSSSKVLLQENPLSLTCRGEGAEVESPQHMLLGMEQSRRSLQQDLALAASLGPGIRQCDSLNPFSGKADQGHLMMEPHGKQRRHLAPSRSASWT